MHKRYIDPLSDFGFKKLFGTEGNKVLLIAFLNALLPARHQIRELSFRSIEFQGRTEFDRKVLFDLYCVSATGERFIVEIQRAFQHFFRDRCLFYSTFPIQDQAERGHWSFRLAPVYVVAILDFEIIDELGNTYVTDEDDYIHLVELKDQRNRVFYDRYKQIYVELPRFRKTHHELADEADRWLYVLRHLAELEELPAGYEDMEVYEKLFESAELAALSREDRRYYEEELKRSRDVKNMIDSALDRGTSRGVAIGIDIGQLRGEKMGKHEEAVQTVKAALTAGLTPEQIATFSSLSLEAIREIALRLVDEQPDGGPDDASN